ncbi:MAG: hypothetical protein HXY21_02575 [Parvularculaceae bacterium]|nr:hypothetical protein [Parvularculaceae bacterium]
MPLRLIGPAPTVAEMNILPKNPQNRDHTSPNACSIPDADFAPAAANLAPHKEQRLVSQLQIYESVTREAFQVNFSGAIERDLSHQRREISAFVRLWTHHFASKTRKSL